jgi:competence CoiA-like predicted nuclease
MYKAINIQDGTSITILDLKWVSAINYLRGLDAQDLLVCQRCKQPMRVRAGKIRHWHFAHKHLLNCPYGQESPALLDARAVLYEWLVSKFGDQVTIEKHIDSAEFERPIDCWVEQGTNSVAYWIMDKAIQPDDRESLRVGFGRLKATVNWLFTASMLRQDESQPESIHLTTTEREFMQHTVYDEVVSGELEGKSLHYLDSDQRTLTTFRGLRLIHSPQLFKGHKHSHAIAEIRVTPEKGEFVHPGEHEQWQEYRRQQAELEKQRQEVEKALARQMQLRRQAMAERPMPASREPEKSQESVPTTLPAVRPGWMELVEGKPQASDQPAQSIYQIEGVCEFCGKRTTDLWYYDGKTRLGKCRTCLAEGKY